MPFIFGTPRSRTSTLIVDSDIDVSTPHKIIADDINCDNFVCPNDMIYKGQFDGIVLPKSSGSIISNSAHGTPLQTAGGIKLFDGLSVGYTHDTVYSPLCPILMPPVIYGSIAIKYIEVVLVVDGENNGGSGGIRSVASDGVTILETYSVSNVGSYAFTFAVEHLAYLQMWVTGGYNLVNGWVNTVYLPW